MGTNDLAASSPLKEFIYDLTTLITQAYTKFPNCKMIYSTLLPRTDIPIQVIVKINERLITACSRLPNVFLVGHENFFAYGPDVLHDDRHIKRCHIGLFATNLINVISGGVRPMQEHSSRPKYKTHNLPNQRPPKPPVGKYTTYSNAGHNTQFRQFPQQAPGPEYVQHQQPTFRREQLPSFPHENQEHEQISYNLNFNKDAIPNEISFLRFIKSYI